MAPLASTRTLVRRLTDPDRPRVAVSLLVLASALLFGAVLVALPSPAEGSDPMQVIDVEGELADLGLLSGPSQVTLPAPDGTSHETHVFVNHRHPGVEVSARLANGQGLTVELEEAGPRATRVHVASATVHRCGRYVGTLILEATHPQLSADLMMMDVRFAACRDTAPVMAVPGSLDDVEPTWAEEGRAPWKPAATTPPPPPPPGPEPAPELASDQEPTPEQGTPTETAEPTSEPSPTTEPTTEPSPTSEPSPDPSPTSDPSPTPEPTSDPSPTSEPTTDPSPTSEPTSDPTSDPSPTSTSSDGDPSPSPTATSTTEA